MSKVIDISSRINRHQKSENVFVPFKPTFELSDCNGHKLLIDAGKIATIECGGSSSILTERELNAIIADWSFNSAELDVQKSVNTCLQAEIIELKTDLEVLRGNYTR